jgi:hypothetical protein
VLGCQISTIGDWRWASEKSPEGGRAIFSIDLIVIGLSRGFGNRQLCTLHRLGDLRLWGCRDRVFA